MKATLLALALGAAVSAIPAVRAHAYPRLRCAQRLFPFDQARSARLQARRRHADRSRDRRAARCASTASSSRPTPQMRHAFATPSAKCARSCPKSKASRATRSRSRSTRSRRSPPRSRTTAMPRARSAERIARARPRDRSQDRRDRQLRSLAGRRHRSARRAAPSKRSCRRSSATSTAQALKVAFTGDEAAAAELEARADGIEQERRSRGREAGRGSSKAAR